MSGKPTRQSRWSVAARCAAAAFGGYGLTYLVTAAIAVGMTVSNPNGRTDAVLAASEISFIVWTITIMACFHTRTATRAWIGIAAACLPPALVVAVLSP